MNADGRLDEDVTYTETYNLKTDATAVMNYYNTTIGYNIQNPEYNAILWIIDNMYLPEHKDATQMKDTLVRKVLKFDGGNNFSEEQLKNLTDDDIEFVQQMALWYFTNHDDTAFAKVYDQFGDNKTSWLFYRTLEMAQNGTSYRSLSDYDYEVTMQEINREISNNMINTICLFADTKYQSVSSSMVKELFNLDKDIIRYVEPTIKEKMLIKKRSIVK